MATRSYSEKNLKALISLTGNECEYRDCGFKLVVKGHFLGEIAHIAGLNPGSPRYDENMTDVERNDNGNLIVLCKNHHGIVDTDTESHTVKLLTEMKTEHEAKVAKSGDTFEPDEHVVSTIIAEMVAEQTNINAGSGTQINQQNFYSTPQELIEHVRLVRRNTRHATENIRRELRSKEPRFDQIKGLLDLMVIRGAFAALEDDDNTLFQNCIDDLKRISGFCFEENTGNLKRNSQNTYLKVIEYIVYSLYEIGAYCIDNEKYEPVRMLSLSISPFGSTRQTNWMYNLTSVLYRQHNYQMSGLFTEVQKHVLASIASRMGWTDDETYKNLTQFEFLGNLYQFYYRNGHDFPIHSAFYEKYDVLKLIEHFINDPRVMQLAFPNVEKSKLAKALLEFDEFAGNQSGVGGGYHTGFHIGTPVQQFTSTYINS